MYKTFLIRIIISIFLATLSLSPGFSMEERVDKSRAAMNLTLSAEQNEFVESLNNNLILKLRKRFEDMVVPFRVLTKENETEDPFYAYYKRVHPNVLKIQKLLKEELPRLKTYYEKNTDLIGTPIDVEAYLTSLQGELIKIFGAFSEESKELIDLKSTAEKAKTKYLYSKIPEFE